MRLTRPLGEGVEPEPFSDLAFRIITDCEKTPYLDGKINYRPRAPTATTVSKPVAGAEVKKDGPTVRWPMTTPLESTNEDK